MYLASSSSEHVDHEAWLIDSWAPFHFIPHMEWFFEYDKYDGGDVFLGHEKKARIFGRGKSKLKLQGGRIRTLPGALHIPTLSINMIFVRKMDDAGHVKTVLEKDTYKMVLQIHFAEMCIEYYSAVIYHTSYRTLQIPSCKTLHCYLSSTPLSSSLSGILLEP